MTAITISRQLGSLGSTLGRQVASRLGYRLVHRELINQAARNAGVPDMALVTIDELGLLGLEPDEKNQRSYLRAVQNIIENLAVEGNVIIVGRAGQVILQDHPSAFHLRVVAPLETRIQRIVEVHGISQHAAKAQIKASDRYRTHYLRRYYHIEWDDPSHYHLVINTGRLSLATATEVVCTALHHRSGHNMIEETHRE